MFSTGTVLFFLALLLLVALTEACSRRLRVSRPLLLVAVGYVCAEIAVGVFHVDTHIHWRNFYSLVYYGLIPVLVFHKAMDLDPEALRRNLYSVLFLSMPLLALTIGLVAFLLYQWVGHPQGFPWSEALLCAVVLSTMDPSAVAPLLKERGVSKRFLTLLEGESLFSDALGVVLFGFLLKWILAENMIAPPVLSMVMDFLHVCVGGVVAGVLLGALFAGLYRWMRHANSQILWMAIFVWGGFWCAERYLGVSGILTILILGLYARRLLAEEEASPTLHGGVVSVSRQDRIRAVMAFLFWLCESMIFVMAGITITISMFTERWLAMLLAVGAVALVRFMNVFFGFGAFCRLFRQEGWSRSDRNLLAWSGARGTMTLALALSLPLAVNSWFTIQSMAYGVVLYALFVQTPLLRLLRKR